MKKFLLIIPFICGIAFINTVRADDVQICTDPETCITTRDDTMPLCKGDLAQVKCDSNFLDLCNATCEPYYKNFQKCTTHGSKSNCINIGNYCDNNKVYIYDTQTKKTYLIPKEGASCTTTGSDVAVCQYNTTNGHPVLSCTAKKCKSNYHMWFYDNKGTGKNSMGVCYTKTQAENYCLNWCTEKYKDKKCTPVLNGKRTTQNKFNNKTYNLTDAFIGCEHETKKGETETQPDKTPEQSSFNSEVFCDAESHKCFSYSIFADIDLKLDKYFAKGSSSVWKNDEGKFNTARLASDSIAGVVLGTVGGVITSNIIKKNQIENGFEDLKCTIGGQTVATFGDEFSVGIR